MQELAQTFPSGVEYNVTLDTTDVINESIDEVLVTFLETTLLVVLVIFLFLQNWRAVIIPCITIPVSLISTLAVIGALDSSISSLTLFGLILAVAIVVDDAIVVVENSSRLLETGQYSPREAVTKAMGRLPVPLSECQCSYCWLYLCRQHLSMVSRTTIQAVCSYHCCIYCIKWFSTP